MVKYFLIIFLSICAFPLKSNAWVGVWLGLEAGVAALDLVTEELSGNSYSSSSKKGKVICIDRNGHQLHNLQVCPPNHKTIYLSEDNSNNSHSTNYKSANKKSNYITKKNNKKNNFKYIYCEHPPGKPYKTSLSTCLDGGKKITLNQYLAKTDTIQCRNNKSGSIGI